jgi:hypothetical protein
MKFQGVTKAVKETKLSYLGNVNSSAKIVKGEKFNELTYILYLAPHKMSGYNVCAGASEECIKLCLNESGQNVMDIHENKINKSRIKKTQILFKERQFFADWVISEITRYKKQAEKKKMNFSVRINGTSDINPEILQKDGKNIFQLFPSVQFYDYTKIFNRSKLLAKYKNYDLTFSFSGENWEECENILKNKSGRVAVVFNKFLPDTYKGYKVVDGDVSDIRYKDEQGVIVGLKYKRVRNKPNFENSKFVVTVNP